MSRLSGLSASNWYDDAPSWNEDYDEQNEEETRQDGTYSGGSVDPVAEYRESFYRDVFVPSLTRHVPVAQRRSKKVTDLTHTIFAAAELDRSVSDVTEEIQYNTALEQHQAIWLTVNSVMERLIATVQLEAESDQRRRLQLVDDRTRRPMCATATFAL